jgi:hypothetical protein
MSTITVLTPTGTLGYGFDTEALKRGMAFEPDVIAVDAGSTDPGPYYLGTGDPLVPRHAVKRELTQLLAAGRSAGIPLVVGSAGGSGCRRAVDWTVDIVREIAAEQEYHLKLAWIYADIEAERVKRALASNRIRDFEAGTPLTTQAVDETTALVAQMGYEPIAAALDEGADVVIAGRACDDLAIAAYAIVNGGDMGLAIHMGKILECGAFSAEPFAMDVMMGFLNHDHFVLEPGSPARRASLKSVAAHTLYERENPFVQHGPGGAVDLSDCRFEPEGDRRVRVSGTRYIKDDEYWIKLEGAKRVGYRTLCIAGIRCPRMIACIDDVLDQVKKRAIDYFDPDVILPTFRVYGRDGVMGCLETERRVASHELCLLIDVTAETQDLARAGCHLISGDLLHVTFPGQVNTSGNLAFPYSPSDIDAGPAFEFSVYHLMQADSPTELFPVHAERV